MKLSQQQGAQQRSQFGGGSYLRGGRKLRASIWKLWRRPRSSQGKIYPGKFLRAKTTGYFFPYDCLFQGKNSQSGTVKNSPQNTRREKSPIASEKTTHAPVQNYGGKNSQQKLLPRRGIFFPQQKITGISTNIGNNKYSSIKSEVFSLLGRF